jgi:hypothetical protein
MADTREFPALPGWTEYEAAVQRYRDLVAERRQHADDLTALERGEDEATKADDQAQATAMLAGDKDPGRKHHTKWKAEREAARTRARVLAAAETSQAEAVLALLGAQPDRAAEAAQDAADAAREAYAATLDGLLEARDAYWRTSRVIGWLADGLPVGRRYKPSGAPPSLQDPREYRPGAVLPEPISARRALAGFRLEVDPEPEPSPVVGYRVQRSQDVRGVDDMTGRRSAIDSITYTPIPVDAQGRRVGRDGPLNR